MNCAPLASASSAPGRAPGRARIGSGGTIRSTAQQSPGRWSRTTISIFEVAATDVLNGTLVLGQVERKS
jgi:hypothetical protein